MKWSQIMDGNCLCTNRQKHSVGFYAGDLQRSIALLVNVVTKKGRRNIGVKLAPPIQNSAYCRVCFHLNSDNKQNMQDHLC